MTRLHIQVNQTIQFYRGQQGGAAPVRLFLSGGASTLPYTAQFFAEKLNMPVDYFNPLRNVQIDPGVNIEELAKIGHQMGELVGLGLRNLAHCPIELNLMPKSALQGQSFNAKKPYLIATMAGFVAILLAFGYFNDRIAGIKRKSLERLEPQLQRLQNENSRLEAEVKQLNVRQNEALQLAAWLEDRGYWGDLLNEIRNVMINTERAAKAEFKSDAGIWIEKFTPDCAVATPQSGMPMPAPGDPAAPAPGGPRRGGPRRGPGGPGGVSTGGNIPCSTIHVILQAVDLTPVSATANSRLGFILQSNLQSSPLLSPTNSYFIGKTDPKDYTFSLQAQIAPKRPLKL